MVSDNMFIDDIDQLLDKLLDSAHTFKMKKITHIDLFKNTSKVTKGIGTDDINFGTDNTQKQIAIILKKMIYIYFLLHSSKSFDNGEQFRNFVVACSDIDNVFNASFVALIIKYSKILEQIMYLSKNTNKISEGQLKIDKYEYKESFALISLIGDDLFQNIDNDNTLHNVLKIVVYQKIFIETEKTNIYALMENEELESLEYKYIDIMVPLKVEVDYFELEQLYRSKGGIFADNNFILEAHAYINNDEIETLTLDDKVNEVMLKNILIPITDDFLRFHKDGEHYENKGEQHTNDIYKKSGKKENTKIRYIITKMNKVIESNNNSKLQQELFGTMYDRKAIFVNNLEEINILKKLENIGVIQKEQQEFYTELKELRDYAYVSFKDFKGDGFTFSPNNNIEAIRYVNIENSSSSKMSHTHKNMIEFRSINKDTEGSIVGFALNKDYNYKRYSYDKYCDTVGNIINVKSFKEDGKPYDLFVKLIREQIINSSVIKKIPYWIFNKNNDTNKKMKEINHLSQDQYYKFLVSYIYDEVETMTYEKIVNILNASGFKSFFQVSELIKTIEESLITLSDQHREYLKKFIIHGLSSSGVNEYDKKEDFIPGKDNVVEQMPALDDVIVDKKQLIISRHEEWLNQQLEDETENAYCQHHVTWDRIAKLRNYHPNMFNQQLYEFTKRYLIENSERDFICKSCYEVVHIKKFINDWKSTTEEGISMTISLRTQLEDLGEYEKYIRSIRELNKIIEKIANGLNMNSMVGNKPQNRMKRQDVIKLIIDLINAQNETMKGLNTIERKERKMTASKKYGFNANQSTFFLFELKNEIFTYSSKETDKFKKPKLNNIMIYILMIFLSEMSDSVISYFPEDKTINYFIFNKIGYDLFDGLLIRVNNSNDVSSVKNYKLLCFVIFLISGFFIKYKLWFGSSGELASSKGLMINEQRFIIHSLFDMLNSILDINSKNNSARENNKNDSMYNKWNFIYSDFSSKFFIKLRTLFHNDMSKEVLSSLDNRIKKKITFLDSKKFVFKTNKEDGIPLTGEWNKIDYGYFHWPVMNKYSIKNMRMVLPSSHYMSNKQHEEFMKEIALKTLGMISLRYNKNGTKSAISKELTNEKDLFEMRTNLTNKNIREGVRFEKKNVHKENIKRVIINEKKGIYEDIEKNLKTEFYKTITATIDGWEAIIGKDININNENIYLKKNVFIIDHMYNGNLRPEPLIFDEFQNKVQFKKNDEHFKMNIYYFFDKQYNVTMYYNATNLSFIAYKEQGKHYTETSNTQKHMTMHYSIKNKLLYLGHKYMHYSYDNKIPISAFVADIIRERIIVLKNVMVNIIKIINQITSKKRKSSMSQISKNHISKFKKININLDGSDFFDDMNSVMTSSFLTPIDSTISIPIENDKLYVGNMIKIDNTDQTLIKYICSEINQLIVRTSDNYTKTQLIFLFSNIINTEFNFINLPEINDNTTEIKKFLLLEIAYYKNFDGAENEIFNDLNEEEAHELEEEQTTERERSEALDVDVDSDGEEQILDSYSGADID
jgi:hypothetical protein